MTHTKEKGGISMNLIVNHEPVGPSLKAGVTRIVPTSTTGNDFYLALQSQEIAIIKDGKQTATIKTKGNVRCMQHNGGITAASMGSRIMFIKDDYVLDEKDYQTFPIIRIMRAKEDQFMVLFQNGEQTIANPYSRCAGEECNSHALPDQAEFEDTMLLVNPKFFSMIYMHDADCAMMFLPLSQMRFRMGLTTYSSDIVASWSLDNLFIHQRSNLNNMHTVSLPSIQCIAITAPGTYYVGTGQGKLYKVQASVQIDYYDIPLWEKMLDAIGTQSQKGMPGTMRNIPYPNYPNYKKP